MHRRTALSVSAALLLAAPLLAACSGEARPGTAAVVGGERITTSALQAQVNDVRAAQNKTGQAAAELIASTPNLERERLDSILQNRIIDKMATTAGIAVSTKEIEDERKAYVEDNKERSSSRRCSCRRATWPPARPTGSSGTACCSPSWPPSTGTGSWRRPARAAAKALRIEVNPRYGAWDAQQIKLGTGQTPWITQRTRPEQEPAGA